MSIELRPFIKWAGGKRQLLSHIESRMPKKFNNYFEPFVGGGALFFYLAPEKAVINDFTEELTNSYLQIKNNPKELMNMLNKYETKHKKNPSEFYYLIRNMDRTNTWAKASLIERATRLIYLNKTCFNGLYRVNKKGLFNVPFNQKKEVKTYDEQNIMNISNYLNNNKIEIMTGDFEEACKKAKKGDFIFFDPPYDTLKKDTFESYTQDGFGVEGQKRLARLFRELDKKGCYLMLTNHNTKLINELYKDYHIDIINVKRMINSNAKKRTGEETIIYNYDLEA